jgi:hypothetical protein
MPPNGVCGDSMLWSLTHTVPARTRAARSRARRRSVPHTEAARPKLVSLATRTASASSATLRIETTGPKISSREIRIWGLASTKTVGFR